MNGHEITVVYQWTAKPGKLDELKANGVSKEEVATAKRQKIADHVSSLQTMEGQADQIGLRLRKHFRGAEAARRVICRGRSNHDNPFQYSWGLL